MSFATGPLANCSSNSFKYLKEPTPIIKNKAKYNVSNVKINFVEGRFDKIRGDLFAIELPKSMKKDFSAYPNEKELSKIFKNILESKLKERGIYSSDANNSNTFMLSMKVDYERLGVLWSKTAYHSFVMSHDIDILKDNEEIARSAVSDYEIQRSGWNGFVSNIKTIFAKKDPQDEIEDLNIVGDVIAREISELGKKVK